MLLIQEATNGFYINLKKNNNECQKAQLFYVQYLGLLASVIIFVIVMKLLAFLQGL